MSPKIIILLLAMAGGFCFWESAFAGVCPVVATAESEPVSHSGDSADDAKVWIHPSDPNLSLVIGTDKHDTEGGLALYDLAGRLISFAQDGKLNNVDVRYNFPLAGKKVDIIAAGNRSNDSIAVYTIDPDTRQLTDIAARIISIGITEAYGFCLYRSRRTGRYYAFLNDKNGDVEQWELFDNQAGMVDAVRVRSFNVGGQTEGMVADDRLGRLYVGEEDVGIWKYGAEPNDPADKTNRVLVDSTNTASGGHLVADVEGLTIYYGRRSDGYLIASSQGEDDRSHPLANTFAVYRRNGDNEYVMSFRVIENPALGIDGVSDTDGIGVTSVSLGSAFPKGLFVAQDGQNSEANQDFKLVPWENIATAIIPHLVIDTGWNPRDIPKDLTGDQIIDFSDIAQFANQWLKTTQLGDTNGDHAVNLCDLHALCSEWLTTMPPLQADFNTDGSVDFGDLAILGSKWRRNRLYLPADFNEDGRVEFADFAELAADWF